MERDPWMLIGRIGAVPFAVSVDAIYFRHIFCPNEEGTMYRGMSTISPDLTRSLLPGAYPICQASSSFVSSPPPILDCHSFNR